MLKNNKITANNIIYAILFLAFGIVLLTSTDDLISIAAKVIGSILILVGIIKIIVYIYMKGKVGDYGLQKLILGLFIVSCGIMFILFSSTLSFAIRIIIGLWVIFSGINRIIFAFTIKPLDNTGFKMYSLTALFMLVLGFVVVSGIFDKFVGLLIILYSVAEIVDYIYYASKGKNFEHANDNKNDLINVKNSKVVDAIVEEDE